MKSPSEYSRRILLAVSGRTPQIVTETLYALTQVNKERFEPTEVHLITTTEGRDWATRLLLSDDPGWFKRLCDDYQLKGIQFSEDTIHVLCNGNGELLDDIKTEGENQCAADGITEFVRQLTADPESALHVSLAGGRKTMGFYIAYALSLFGREQDRLSHVLVHQDFENAPGFFYKRPADEIIERPGKKPLDTKDGEITLASIPFVSMRPTLPSAMLRGVNTYSEVVGAASMAMTPEKLTIDLRGGRIRAAGRIIEIPRAQIAFLSVFALRAKEKQGAIAPPAKSYAGSSPSNPVWAEIYRAELRKCADDGFDLNRLADEALETGMDGEYFAMQLARLHKVLKDELGALAAPYLIKKIRGSTDKGSDTDRSEEDDAKKSEKGYKMTLEPGAIEYEPLPEPANAGRVLFLPPLPDTSIQAGAPARSEKAGAQSRGK